MIVLSALKDLLPAEAIAEPDDRRWGSLVGVPEAVVSPTTAEEVAAVLSWASAEGVGVVPAGSGRRLGPRQMHGRFVVLTSDRLTGIEIYEPADVTFTALAGTPVSEVDSELRANAQWLPLDGSDVLQRSLGGLVAIGSSGPLWMGYGELRNHVLGMTAVTGDGRVLRLGGRVVKNVAGFDLLKPMVGSRGALAVITSVCMRAFPLPAVDRVLLGRAATAQELLPTALAVGTAPVMPVSCAITSAGGEATLAVRLHGAEPTVDSDRRTLEAHIATSLEAGHSPDVPEAGADTIVSLSLLPSRLPELLSIVDPGGFRFVTIDTYSGRVRAGMGGFDAEALASMLPEVERLGGALSIERAPQGADVASLESVPSDDERRLTERIRRAFDPECVLWRS